MRRPIVSAIVLLLVACSQAAVYAMDDAVPVASTARDLPELVRRATENARDSQWKEAARLWSSVVEANPVNGDYWIQLGRARYAAKDYSGAIPAFEKVLELGTGYPFDAAYNVACCQALLGEREKALAWLTKALDLGYRDLKHVQTDEDLKSLHDDSRFTILAALADVSRMSRDEGWRHDLWLLSREVRRIHFRPMRPVSDGELEAIVRKLHDEIPRLTDAQITVELMKLMRLFGDGHTVIRPAELPKSLPVQFFLFQEGLFVTAAAPQHADLAGARVLTVGGKTVETVLKGLDPVISRDNVIWPTLIGPDLLRMPLLLHTLGLVPDSDRVTLGLQDSDGTSREVTVVADASELSADWVIADHAARGPKPLYLRKLEAPYWFEFIPDERLVYFQYNSVRDDPTESLDRFCTRLFQFIEEHPVERLVVDLRWNDGGNNFLNRPLTHGLIRCDKINQPGRLFVIVGRKTFSAAMCCATHIERHTQAIFVGEPTGSRPNFVGESIPVRLPYSGMRGTISDLYWQNSTAMDYRTWIAPTLYAPPTFALFRDRRDPAMEAILSYRSKGLSESDSPKAENPAQN